MIEDLERLAEETELRRDWTPEEDEILLEYYKRVPTTAILRHLSGRTCSGLYSHIRLLKAAGRQFKYDQRPE